MGAAITVENVAVLVRGTLDGRQVGFQRSSLVVGVEILTAAGAGTAEVEGAGMVRITVGPQVLVGDAVEAEVFADTPLHLDQQRLPGFKAEVVIRPREGRARQAFRVLVITTHPFAACVRYAWGEWIGFVKRSRAVVEVPDLV